MKLKEKLAKEYVEENDPLGGLISHYKDGLEVGFLAGFEKAREMAAKIAYGPQFDGTGDEIDCLGEEEVKE